ERGANQDAKDQYNCVPLHRACEHGSTAAVELLVAEGSSLEAKTKVHVDRECGDIGNIQ
ncbi:hypothetical protein SARC_12746, partial [Sphaeroforma arctica JP610]